MIFPTATVTLVKQTAASISLVKLEPLPVTVEPSQNVFIINVSAISNRQLATNSTYPNVRP